MKKRYVLFAFCLALLLALPAALAEDRAVPFEGSYNEDVY